MSIFDKLLLSLTTHYFADGVQDFADGVQGHAYNFGYVLTGV